MPSIHRQFSASGVDSRTSFDRIPEARQHPGYAPGIPCAGGVFIFALMFRAIIDVTEISLFWACEQHQACVEGARRHSVDRVDTGRCTSIAMLKSVAVLHWPLPISEICGEALGRRLAFEQYHTDPGSPTASRIRPPASLAPGGVFTCSIVAITALPYGNVVCRSYLCRSCLCSSVAVAVWSVHVLLAERNGLRVEAERRCRSQEPKQTRRRRQVPIEMPTLLRKPGGSPAPKLRRCRVHQDRGD